MNILQVVIINYCRSSGIVETKKKKAKSNIGSNSLKHNANGTILDA